MELTNWKISETTVGDNILIDSSPSVRTILSINVTNNSNSTQIVSLFVKNSATDYSVIKDLELYSHETLIKDDKLILQPDDVLYLSTSVTDISVLISGVIM